MSHAVHRFPFGAAQHRVHSKFQLGTASMGKWGPNKNLLAPDDSLLPHPWFEALQKTNMCDRYTSQISLVICNIHIIAMPMMVWTQASQN